MKSWQVITLGIILLSGYALFAIGGYLVGANVAAQEWQARVAYIAHAEECVCYVRTYGAGDASALMLTEAPTADVCANFRESAGALDIQVATWKSITPPTEWRGWHTDILSAMETICQGYEHLLTACQYYDEWELDDSATELDAGLDLMLVAIESLRPERRPWAH